MNKLTFIEKGLAKLIEKIGIDRILHFLVAYAIVATCLIYGIGYGGWATFVVTGLAFIKEKFIDEKFDTVDLLASFFGCAAAMLMYIPYDALC